jgi:hypothetical protein
MPVMVADEYSGAIVNTELIGFEGMYKGKVLCSDIRMVQGGRSLTYPPYRFNKCIAMQPRKLFDSRLKRYSNLEVIRLLDYSCIPIFH